MPAFVKYVQLSNSAFAKVSINFVITVRVYQRASHWTYFHVKFVIVDLHEYLIKVSLNVDHNATLVIYAGKIRQSDNVLIMYIFSILIFCQLGTTREDVA